MTQYKTQYGTIFAVKEHNGAPAIMCRAELSETWSLSSMITPFTPGAWTAEELQGQLDNWAATKGWQPVAEPASAEPPEIVDECSEPDEECPYLQPLENSKKYSCQCALCGDKFVNREICNKSFHGCGWYLDRQGRDARQDDEEEIPATEACQCRTCEQESCFAHGCTKECPANAEESCLTPNCPEYRTPCTDCRCPECDDDACPQAQCDGSDKGLGCMAPDDDCPPQSPTPAAPASPADAGVAEQSLCAAAPASLEAKDMNVPAFDYSGLDDQTAADVRLGEREFIGGRKMTEVGLRRMADGVAIVHDALCCTDATNCRNGDGQFTTPEHSFGAWCNSVGLNRKAAERLLQVSKLFDNSSPRHQKVLENLGTSLLYEVAKPSAPAELVQAVKDGDITSHKQYQEVLAKLKDEQASRQAAESRARAAENRAEGAEKLATLRGSENTELKAKIRELENQPRDVAVVQLGEEQIEAWRREGADRMAATMQETVRKANEEKLKAQNRVTYLQEQLATARPDADACQRTVDILYETTENMRLLLRSQLKQAQLPAATYGKVVAHVLQVARTLLDTVRVCAPDGYDVDSEEDDDFA